MASKRTETSTEIVKVAPPPSYLAELAKNDDSLDTLGQYRVLQRVAVLQALSDAALKEAFGEGALVLQPGGVGLCKKGETMLFVPIFHFTEFIKWRDRRDKGGNATIERTFEHGSSLAARARNSATRLEQYAGGPADNPYRYRYVEHINFAGLILKPGDSARDAVDPSTPCVLGFSRGEFFNGQMFSTAIVKRRTPLWSQVWELQIGEHKNKKGDRWWGIDYSVNPARPWASEEEAPAFKALHESLKAEHAKKTLVVDQSGAETDDIDDEPLGAPTGATPAPNDKF